MNASTPAQPTAVEAGSLALYTSLTSPFGRKVRMAALSAGVDHLLRVVPTDAMQQDATLLAANPLGKVPVLLLPDGRGVYDSRLIVDYLDGLAGNAVLLPREPEPRLEVLRQQALADGLLDAAVLRVYESRFRDAGAHSAVWLERQDGKVARALDHAEQHLAGGQPAAAPHIGDITLAAALGFLDYRLPARDWRGTRPKLAAWLARFEAAGPVFAATAPPPL